MLKLSRYLTISAFALAITLGCFYTMQQFMGEGSYTPVPPSLPIFKFVDVSIPEQEIPPRPVLPEQQPKPQLPRPDTSIAISVPDLNLDLQITDIPTMSGPPTILIATTGEQPAVTGQTSELAVTVPIAPHYPVDAAIAGIEGWVEVRFTVTASGGVTDVRVMDSHPAGVFDDAAKAAVRKWQFQPRRINGLPTQGQATQIIEFNLASD